MKNMKLSIFAILIVLTATSAFALGVTPSRVILDFNDDLKEEVIFRIINNEGKDFNVHVYARGELAEYIGLENKLISILADQKETTIRYKIDVPYSERQPGMNLIEVVVEETAADSDKDTVIIGRIAVVHQLYLRAPFEGKYARAIFTSNNPEEDEDLLFTYTIFNDGTEKLDKFTAELEVYTEELELVGKMDYEFAGLEPGEYMKEVRMFNQKMSPGTYIAKTIIKYEGRELLKETTFTVGGAYIEVGEIKAQNFKLGEINKLDFYLYNKFFKEIENVFAEVIVKDKDNKVYSIFKTVSNDLPPFTGKEFVGYWDTKGMSQGLYSMLVKVNHGGRISEEEFDITVLPNELRSSKITGQVITGETKVKNPLIPTLILAFIILIIVNIALVIYIRRNKKPPEIINSFIVLVISFLH